MAREPWQTLRGTRVGAHPPPPSTPDPRSVKIGETDNTTHGVELSSWWEDDQQALPAFDRVC